MGREGIDRFYVKDNEDTYDMLGAKTLFRVVTEKMVENVVSEGNWFSFCTKINSSQKDIMSEKNSDGVKIGKFAADIFPETMYRSAIYKYLLRDYLCYYEAPTVVKDTSSNYGFKSSYDKYLVTSNLEVIARWLNMNIEDADILYGSRIEESCDDNECDMFPYVKLYITKEGVRKVSKPRKDLDLSTEGTRIIPLYALKKGIDILYEKAKDDFYNVDYVKDGGQVRTVNITFNVDKLRDIYGSSDFLLKGLESMYDGDFEGNPNIERGYIRIFEVGSSKYDSPLRAINYARILGFKKEEPDLTYINIDLSSVLSTFVSHINSINADIEEIVDMLDVFEVGSERKVNGREIKTTQDLEIWAENQEILLSTVFLRKLALFMIGNSHWFGGYTGEPKDEKTYVSTGDELDSIDSFEFDIV